MAKSTCLLPQLLTSYLVTHLPAHVCHSVYVFNETLGWLKYVFDGVDAEGKTFHDEATSKFDGKDYPFMSSYADTIASRRINVTMVEFVTKKGGKEVSRGREVISKDGRTITATEKGKDAKGQDFNRTEVFDKQ